ncbi:hypothetical protein NMK44_33445 [Streptomyces sp. NEAU-Y11]|nr:hypothetical protein [Streptomyces sp. NEAU-Y11]
MATSMMRSRVLIPRARRRTAGCPDVEDVFEPDAEDDFGFAATGTTDE